MAKRLIYISIFVFYCSGCASNDGLIPHQDYTELFVEKQLNGDVEYEKIGVQKKINKIIGLLNSVSVKSSGDLKTGEEGTYILSFWTKKDLDNREINSPFYMALLQDGSIAYSGHGDVVMNVRYVSVKKEPELVKEMTEMIY